MWVLAVTAWVVVVIAGSALTWVAIDRAGRQVTGNPSAAQTQPVVVGTIGTAPTDTRTPTRKPSSAATASVTPQHPASVSPTPRPTRSNSPSATKTSASDADRTETRTWSGAAGSVTVACTGRTARLKGTSPSDGWHVEVGDSSGGEVEVTFKKDAAEVQVKATCVGGVPRFQAESDTSGGGGDD
jgi:hypothetical protein